MNRNMATTLSFSTVRFCAGMVICGLFLPLSQAQTTDTAPPQLGSFAFSPNAVDVTVAALPPGSTGQRVLVTLGVSDNLSGAQYVQVTFTSPSFAQFQTAFCGLIAGTPQNGTWQGSLTIPKFAEPGTWKASVFLRDVDTNTVNLGPAALQAGGFPTDLAVTSTPDLAGPVLTGLTITPAAVDTSTGPASLVIHLSLSDSPAGVSFACDPYCYYSIIMQGPSGAQAIYDSDFNFRLISGTVFSGTWEIVFTLPRFAAAGTWSIQSLLLRDAAGNRAFLDASALIGRPGVTHQVTVTSNPSDTTPLTLNTFSFSPAFIDTSLSAQAVDLTLFATDDLSGPNFLPGYASPRYNLGYIYFRSPSGGQYLYITPYFNGTVIESVNPPRAQWTVSATFPRYSEQGTWQVQSMVLYDYAGNPRYFSTADLKNLHFPTDLVVIQPSLVSDGTISNPAAGGVVADQTFGSRAEVIVPPGVLSSPTSIAIDVFQTPLDLPRPSGFSALGSYFVNINLSPQPSYPLPAPGLTLVLPLANAMVPGDRLDLYRVDPSTGNLVPSLNAAGQPVVGTVDAGGLSATFTGISKLSVVVGLIPDTIPVLIDIKPGEVPNSINPGNQGVVPVGILSTPVFSAPTSIRPGSLTFGRTGDEASLASCASQDLNGDGRADLICQFYTQKAGFQSGDTQGILKGKTVANINIRGVDSIRTVPSN
jgi:hypothetical protein